MEAVFSLWTPTLDMSGYRKVLERQMTEAIAQALAGWLEAVLAEIPVWSGASRATFIKLAQQIQYSVPLASARGRMNRTGMGQAASAGTMIRDISTGEFTFTYSTTLPWLIWNEYHNANVEPDPSLFYRVLQEGPYNFQNIGAAVFKAFAAKVMLPEVAPYVRSKSVRA